MAQAKGLDICSYYVLVVLWKEFDEHMDWDKVIERNQAALIRIVAMLIAMVEMGTGSMVALLPPSLYRAVSRMLLPTESAVRRLIAIAARGLKVKPAPPRPMPKGLAFAGKGGGQIAFQLFDTRQRFSRNSRRRAAATVNPRIHVFADSPLVPLFQPRRPVESPIPRSRMTPSMRRASAAVSPRSRWRWTTCRNKPGVWRAGKPGATGCKNPPSCRRSAPVRRPAIARRR